MARMDARQLSAAALNALRSGGVVARNLLLRSLPTPKTDWVVLELTGSYPTRRRKRKLLSIESLAATEREASLEELSAQVAALCRTPEVKGVVLRLQGLNVGLATAFAVRNLIARLRGAGKQTVVWAEALDTTSYYVATAAGRVAVPPSAELWVHGTSLGVTFMADALARVGISVERLAIGEYKNAPDQLARSDMSPAHREQLEALLDSVQATVHAAVGADRGRETAVVADWWDAGVTEAEAAKSLGMVDSVAYEDELMGAKPIPASKAVAFAPGLRRPGTSRVAVVSLQGTIVPGRSRRSPVPLPVFGGTMAGSETLVRGLRAAGRDPYTRAVVFHVDSGGGSALASDLIGREVELLARRMPVVAVMGELAASGGYYVLTHATRVLAAPTTLTGSIGVFTAKPVLEAFNQRFGLNPVTLRRGRYANAMSFARPWDEAETELFERYIGEVYERFVTRVATGRGLDPLRVDEIGRGRIWTGADALDLGLVDELGDVDEALAVARELAGLHPTAPSWNVKQQPRMVLPDPSDPDALSTALMPLLRERALLVPSTWLSLS